MIRHKLSTQWLDDREVGWRRVWSASYTWRRREARVFRFSLKTDGYSLSVVCPQNHCNGFLVWPLKLRLMILWFEPQNHHANFWFVPQNQVRGCLLVYVSKLMSEWRRCEDTHRHPAACFVVKQVELGFPSFASKLAKERRQVVHVASSQRSRGSKAKDGQFDGVRCGSVKVRPNYPSLDIIFLLAHMGILVFCFCYK
jgi:hypothetical protein